MSDSRISAAMRAAVGTEVGRRKSHPISVSDIRRWALAVYWPEPAPKAFTDEHYAAGTAHGGIVAPEDFNPFAWACAETWLPIPAACANPGDPDHTETRVGIPGPGLRSRLNGGSQTEYGVRMRPGDIIRSTRRLGPYSERGGRLGRMLLSTTEDTWTNQYDELVKRIVMTLIRY